MKKKVLSNAPKELLFEIGTEELPATNLADIFETAKQEKQEPMPAARFKKIFEEKRLSYASLEFYATSRRLVFYAKRVAPRQSVKQNLIKGPSKQDAYLADGTPTEKLLGFLKAKKASLKDIEVHALQGKDYVHVRQEELAEETSKLLPQIFEELIRSLSFPKTMRWDDSGLYFPRPIRNLLCFYGNKPVSFKIGRLTVKNQTSFFLKSRRSLVTVTSIPAYFAALKARGVILDQTSRKKDIETKLLRSASAFGGALYADAHLLGEVNFLVENPRVFVAPFAEEFLSLPLEVLTVSMARKQRIFGVLDKSGHVMPRFLGVADGDFTDKAIREISANYEQILRAKLKDSLFFYEEDVRAPLSEKVPALKNLVFIKNAGSMQEKSERLAKLSETIAQGVGLPEKDRKDLLRACALSKADLLTHMVGEFPELQGIMGKYYALASHEPAQVATALGEQYLPRTAQDALPVSLVGSLLSLMDKCDLVTACFGLGLEPSSSGDPYGLRRSVSGVIKIWLERKLTLSLSAVLNRALEELGRFVVKDRQEVFRRVEALFKDRFTALMVDRGYRAEWVEAVISSSFDDLNDVYERLDALSKLGVGGEFAKAWKVVERTANILRSSKEKPGTAIDPACLHEAVEKEVFQSFEQSKKSIEEATRGRDYRRATSLYAAAFFDILDQFFEKVFVNTEDPNVRRNRLALLSSINGLYTDKIADLSKIHLL